MRRDLKIEHVADLFEKPTRLATLATHRADGSILLSPVGFLWEDGGFSIGSYTEAFLVRKIERDPLVSDCVAEEEPPFGCLRCNATGWSRIWFRRWMK